MKRLIKYSFLLLFMSNLTTSVAQNDVETLTLKLTENLANDSLKVLSIYNWITQNIRYDHTFRNRQEGDTTLTQEPYTVVVKRKAVCVGYSKLVKEMCRVCGIESVVIYGFAKSNNRVIDNEGHAWNVVKINNNWYALDATWDSAEGFNSKKYLFSTPSVFLETHLPHDPMWQLSTQPIPYDCFTYNRNCNNEAFKNFNFKDTIALWQGLDTLGSLYNESVRRLRFNENDVDAMRNLGEFYFKKAFQTFLRYTTIKEAVKSKKQKPINKQAVLAILDETEICGHLGPEGNLQVWEPVAEIAD